MSKIDWHRVWVDPNWRHQVTNGIINGVIFGALALIGSAIYLGMSRSHLPLSLYLVGGVILGPLAGFCLWFVVSNEKAQTEESTAKADAPGKAEKLRIKTLHELYKTDYSAYHKTGSSLPASTADGKLIGKIDFAVCFDLSTNSKFLMVYIPRGLNPVKSCDAVARDYNTLMLEDTAKSGLSVTAKAPGETGSASSSELVFTGKIYIYHEEELTLAELARLDALFREKKTSAHFRGQDYVSTSFLRERAALKPD